MLLCFAVFFITELYLFVLALCYTLREFDELGNYSISFSLKSSIGSLLSVWHEELILRILVWVRDMILSVYFFLIGCNPSWYRSGKIELTLLISRHLRFLTGLLIYLIYRTPRRLPERLSNFSVFFEVSILGVGSFLGWISTLGISLSFNYPSSGLLSEPDWIWFPTSSKFLLFFSSEIDFV